MAGAPARSSTPQAHVTTLEFAGFRRRFVAHLVDLAIVGSATAVLSAMLVAVNSDYGYRDPVTGWSGPFHLLPFPLAPPISEFLYVLMATANDDYATGGDAVASIWPSLLGIAYHIVLLNWKGQTVGKAILGVAILREDRRLPSYSSALLRETLGKAISSILFVGFMIIAFSGNKRGLHDLIADTQAVRVPIGFHLWIESNRSQSKGVDR